MVNEILSGGPVWAWGTFLIALTIAVHTTGVVMIALVGVRLRIWIQNRHSNAVFAISIVIGVVASTGVLLAMLHGIEAAIWASAYLYLGIFKSFADALLYSIDAITTYGGSGLMPQRHWLMLGALEAAGGVLLFGISTAYMFAVIQAYWPLLSTPWQTDSR